jgi:hypothetical protein
MPSTGTWSELEFPREPSAKPAALALCTVSALNYRNIDGHVARVTYGYSYRLGTNFVYLGKGNINIGRNLRLYLDDIERVRSLLDFLHFESHYTRMPWKELS